jgi:hypothetical protein
MQIDGFGVNLDGAAGKVEYCDCTVHEVVAGNAVFDTGVVAIRKAVGDNIVNRVSIDRE